MKQIRIALSTLAVAVAIAGVALNSTAKPQGFLLDPKATDNTIPCFVIGTCSNAGGPLCVANSLTLYRTEQLGTGGHCTLALRGVFTPTGGGPE